MISRAEGQYGGHELCSLLSDRIGLDLTRNLDQYPSCSAEIALPGHAHRGKAWRAVFVQVD